MRCQYLQGQNSVAKKKYSCRRHPCRTRSEFCVLRLIVAVCLPECLGRVLWEWTGILFGSGSPGKYLLDQLARNWDPDRRQERPLCCCSCFFLLLQLIAERFLAFLELDGGNKVERCFPLLSVKKDVHIVFYEGLKQPLYLAKH